jgi:hypothetical protein
MYNNNVCIFLGPLYTRVFCRRINAGERLLSVFVFSAVLCGLPLPVTVLCPSTISAPNVAADTEFLGVLKCRRVKLPVNGPVTPFPEDKDDPCPVCRELQFGKLCRCKVSS